jgi:hypothetical protein
MKSEDLVVGGSIVDGQLFLSYATISQPLFVIQCKWFSSPFCSEQGTVCFKAAEIMRPVDEFFGTDPIEFTVCFKAAEIMQPVDEIFGTDPIEFTVSHLNPSAELDPEHPELGQWPVGAALPWLHRWLIRNERLLNKDYFAK